MRKKKKGVGVREKQKKNRVLMNRWMNEWEDRSVG